MAINIRNREAEELARELAELTNDSITGAVVLALRDRLAKVRASSPSGPSVDAERLEALRAISADAAPRWMSEHRSTDHATLLYDEQGLPA